MCCKKIRPDGVAVFNLGHDPKIANNFSTFPARHVSLYVWHGLHSEFIFKFFFLSETLDIDYIRKPRPIIYTTLSHIAAKCTYV